MNTATGHVHVSTYAIGRMCAIGRVRVIGRALMRMRPTILRTICLSCSKSLIFVININGKGWQRERPKIINFSYVRKKVEST